jgi:hypothetical protein
VTGTVLVIALAFVTPILATSSPASADTVVDGCTIVSNPTSSNFTNCPGADLSGANLSAVNLSFAKLSGTQFAGDCVFAFPIFPVVQCKAASLSGVNLTGADLSSASFAACASFVNNLVVGCEGSGLSGADLTDTNLANTTWAACAVESPFGLAASVCSGADLSGASLSGADLTGATIEACLIPGIACTSANLSGANLTGTVFVPSDQTVPATSSAGAVVTYSIPTPLTTAMPTTCSAPSGSTFPIGSTTMTCTVFDDQGDQATGTFTVTVQGAPEQLASLLVTVTNIGPGTSLADKVQAAQAAVAADLPAQAIGDLKALINEVQAKMGKTLTPTETTAIVAVSKRVINVLST